MRFVAQVILNGLLIGCVYALLGTAWNVIYHTTRTFHFAHGTVFLAAAYTAALLSPRVGLPAASIVAVLIAVTTGCAIERFIYRPMRRKGAALFIIFIASLGVYIVGENLITLFFTGKLRRVEGFRAEPLLIGSLTLTSLHVLTVIVSLSSIGVLYVYLSRGRGGKSIRALASSVDMAEVVGISRDRVYLLSFALGSGGAGVAAILWALDKSVLPTMAIAPLFVGFVVSIVGGLGSVPGAVVAGLLLGLAENLTLLVWAPEMSAMVSFIVLILIVAIRPTGLFASEVEKLG